MSNLLFYIVNVFAEKKYTGNPLTVIRGGQDLTTEKMQALAKEMNSANTVFLLNEEPCDDGYKLRIFTPETELPFATYPALGASYIIATEIIRRPVNRIQINLPSGHVSICLRYKPYAPNEIEIVWMQQRPPLFGQTFEREHMAKLLQLAEKDIDNDFPIQEVSTGLPFIIVPLKGLKAVQQAQIAKRHYFELIKTTQAKAVLIFSAQTYDLHHDLNVRVFAQYYGIAEDPATGSANGCLAAYLYEYNYFQQHPLFLRAEQGYEIDRPSLLLLRVEEKDSTLNVAVGGQVLLTARGEFV